MNITASELRIGNLLRACFTNEITEVDWLVLKHISDGNIQSPYDTIPVYEPIPITTDWLVWAGFESKRIYDEVYEWTSERYKTESSRFRIQSVNDFCFLCGNTTNPEIKYVHQFQNLYFTLTGEELKFNRG